MDKVSIKIDKWTHSFEPGNFLFHCYGVIYAIMRSLAQSVQLSCPLWNYLMLHESSTATPLTLHLNGIGRAKSVPGFDPQDTTHRRWACLSRLLPQRDFISCFPEKLLNSGTLKPSTGDGSYVMSSSMAETLPTTSRATVANSRHHFCFTLNENHPSNQKKRSRQPSLCLGFGRPHPALSHGVA